MIRFPLMGRLTALAFLAFTVASAAAQTPGRLYNQETIGELLYGTRQSLDEIPEVEWRAWVLEHPTNNSIFARSDLYAWAGDGDFALGKERLQMVQFLNRVYLSDLRIGDTLVVPSQLDLDPRAYGPFPLQYAGAEDFDKLFVIHKGVQAWAAYEDGELERWGLVNTGAIDSQTPAGRYNFNWKELDRISTLSPPGERWRMRWVFNFHHERGIHVHQYRMPIGEPASHGCVRLITQDAKWIYDWADGWRTTAGTAEDGLPSADGRILEQGTTVLVLGDGEEPLDGPPARFTWEDGEPVLRVVTLPEDPYTVPPGTPQQEMFDRRRAREAQSTSAP
ncbi:MAG: L,D-transpeptidase [Bacteroidota bacterium]